MDWYSLIGLCFKNVAWKKFLQNFFDISVLIHIRHLGTKNRTIMFSYLYVNLSVCIDAHRYLTLVEILHMLGRYVVLYVLPTYQIYPYFWSHFLYGAVARYYTFLIDIVDLRKIFNFQKTAFLSEKSKRT